MGRYKTKIMANREYNKLKKRGYKVNLYRDGLTDEYIVTKEFRQIYWYN